MCSPGERGEDDPMLPASHWVSARGSKRWCEQWIEDNGRSVISHRQYLSYLECEYAARFQVIQSPRQAPVYDVPIDLSYDEKTQEEGGAGFPQFAASFHKLMSHDPDTGLLTQDPTGTHQHSGVQNYVQLLEGLLNQGAPSNFNTELLNSLELCNRHPTDASGKELRPRVLINPRSSKALSIKGADIVLLDVSRILYGASDHRRLLKQISLSSDETAAEMLEVYAMAMLRNVELGKYQSGTVEVDLAIEALNSCGDAFVWGYDSNFNKVTAKTLPVTTENLFRGPTKGDRQGEYLSVFLDFARPPLFPSGCAPHVSDLIGAGQFVEVLKTELQVPQGKDDDFGLTWEHYVRIQNAEVPKKYQPGHFTSPDKLTTGRNLGDYVHVDNVYEQYIRAADILVGNQYNRSENFPYTEGAAPYYKNEGDGPTLGPSDAYGLIGGVRLAAERASFTQKWLVARRARPEVMAALIHQAYIGNDALRERLSGMLFGDGSSGQLLQKVFQWNGGRPGGEENYLLSQMYPEGSPAHPSWTSGHATVAGACVTVLKAIFNDSEQIIKPDSPPGDKPQFYVAPDGAKPTVGEELDKLASNISLGRNFGGVHYRSDGEHGILLGEEVAIRYLQDHVRTYREEFDNCHGFTLTKRNGTRICITANDVREIQAAVKYSGVKQPVIYPKSAL